jgi:hypothetical protein
MTVPPYGFWKADLGLKSPAPQIGKKAFLVSG